MSVEFFGRRKGKNHSTEMDPIIPRRSVAQQTLEDLAEENNYTGRQLPPPTPQRQEELMPDYITQQEGVSRVGILTSTAMAQEYEKTAKEIELMGQELLAAKTRCEEISGFLDESIEHVRKTAEHFRDEARRVVKQLEDYAMLTEQVRRTCFQMTGDIRDTTTKEPVIESPSKNEEEGEVAESES